MVPAYSTSAFKNPNLGSVYDNTGKLLLGNTVSTGIILTPGFYTDSSGNNYVNFHDNNWNTDGSTAICSQKQWTGLTNIVWDGVSNYNSC